MSDIALTFAPLTAADLPLVEKLDERAFGPGRFSRSAFRLREGRAPDFSLSRTARVGSFLVGANRITPVVCGQTSVLLLGPLTVEPAFQSRGIGEALVQHSQAAARLAGHGLMVLVGDAPFYTRMGFCRVPTGQVTLPGPVDPARILACELVPGQLAAVRGQLRRA